MKKKRMVILAWALAAGLLAGCTAPASSQPPEESKSILEEAPVEEGLSPVGSRWYEEPVEEVIPSPDYGELVPYVGAVYYQMLPGENGEQVQDTAPSSLFGLMTLEGQVVLDPVCTGIYPAQYRDRTGELVVLPVWELFQADPEAAFGEGERMALCAKDGSWSTGFLYDGAAASPMGLFAGGTEGMFLLDPETGGVQTFWSWEELGVQSPEQIPWTGGDVDSTVHWAGDLLYLGTWGENWDTALLLDPEEGTAFTMPAQEWYEQEASYLLPGEEGWRVEAAADGTVTVSRGEESYTFPTPLSEDPYPYAREDRVIFQDRALGRFAVTTLEGRTILPAQDGEMSVLACEGGFYFAVRSAPEADWALYSWDGQPLATLPGETGSWCGEAGPLVRVSWEDGVAYYRPETGECVFRTYFALENQTEGAGEDA